jgi:G3E family GTPase
MDVGPRIIVVGGYLGAGKTTLVSHLLATKGARTVAVVVNELAPLGVDGELLDAFRGAVTELRDGCICCANLEAFEQALVSLVCEPADVIVIELSGQASDAGPLQVIGRLSRRHALRLPLRVVVVDAVNHRAHAPDPVLRDQLAYADIIVLNKAGEVAREELAAVQTILEGQVPWATVLRTTRSVLRWEDLRAPDVEGALRVRPAAIHVHDSSIAMVAVDLAGEIDVDRFDAWLQGFLALFGDDVLRAKGWLNVGLRPRRVVFQAVHRHVEVTDGSAWASDERRVNRLVMIGRELRAQDVRAAFSSCVRLSGPSPE